MLQWIEDAIEKVINRFCGRWLSNFTKDQMEIDMVSGKILLRNLIIQTTELEALCLPCQPRSLFIGKIFIQFSHVKPGLQIELSDILALLRASDTDSGFWDVRQVK